jgi:hypothetical protein
VVFVNLWFLLALLVFAGLLGPTIAFPLLRTFTKQWRFIFVILSIFSFMLVVEFLIVNGLEHQNCFIWLLKYTLYFFFFMAVPVVRQLSMASMNFRTTTTSIWENEEQIGLLSNTTSDGSLSKNPCSTITEERVEEEDNSINKDSSKAGFLSYATCLLFSIDISFRQHIQFFPNTLSNAFANFFLLETIFDEECLEYGRPSGLSMVEQPPSPHNKSY